MKGMGKVSASSLGSAAHHEAMERMHGSIGERHEEEARRYAPGSRQHEFHDSISRSHYYAADSHFMSKQKTVSAKAEPVSSHLTRTSSLGPKMTGKPVMGNRNGSDN